MLNTSYRIMRNTETAEDMLQEAFLQAFMTLSSFRYDSSFGSWLKRIVINTCINELKRRKVELVLMDDLQVIYPDHIEGDDEFSYSVKDVTTAMEKLPSGARTIFSLYLLEGYDHQEIAQILSISISASKSQYSRAKSSIRKTLSSKYTKTSSGSVFPGKTNSISGGLSHAAKISAAI